ncbi:hypothetical protein [Chryseobacterium salivictor]|uniref:Uncharacterized protein n=1 Tax=Chryseobacterium salivictor TaxID=2547600 RepID=A0A4P6ZJ70_9FLAO|nr:hypothetical protein [Chryseobacterium salivictor]QBO59617.1 hypothetical protein NBC122_02816 [Chryseobacterium salivictor]
MTHRFRDDEDKFIVEESKENFETWTSKDFISSEIRESIKSASILIVPTIGFREPNELTFPIGTEDFFQYIKENLPENFTIDFCINDDDYQELALYSNYRRLGNFLVTTVALSVFLNLLSSYIYDKAIKEDESKPPIQIINIDNSKHQTIINSTEETKLPKKFLEAPKVKFSITVVDRNGTSKDFHYEGPAKDVKNITEEIKKLWDNESK